MSQRGSLIWKQPQSACAGGHIQQYFKNVRQKSCLSTSIGPCLDTYVLRLLETNNTSTPPNAYSSLLLRISFCQIWGEQST